MTGQSIVAVGASDQQQKLISGLTPWLHNLAKAYHYVYTKQSDTGREFFGLIRDLINYLAAVLLTSIFLALIVTVSIITIFNVVSLLLLLLL